MVVDTLVHGSEERMTISYWNQPIEGTGSALSHTNEHISSNDSTRLLQKTKKVCVGIADLIRIFLTKIVQVCM